MGLDGGPLTRLTTNAAKDVDPVWSPLNDRIAFVSDRPGGFAIFTMKTDGSGVTQMTPTTHGGPGVATPDWDSDGSRLMFTDFTGASSLIMVMPSVAMAGGQQVSALEAHNTRGVFAPDPSPEPDGRALFQTDREGTLDLVMRRIDGSGGSYEPGYITRDELQPDWQPIPAFPLVDARFSAFKVDIEWVFAEGITTGCSAERYCPNAPVTRGQMASFLARALHLSGSAPDVFTDDETSAHEPNINLVAQAGIASGCAPGKFCPDGLVSREQMASFLARALHLSGTAPDAFIDDESSIHEPNINLVARDGIASGCGGGKYCPTANVTRGQMAAFLHRAFGP
jgi:hypothetical protein